MAFAPELAGDAIARGLMDVNNNNNIAASRSADHLALRIAVITSTRLRFVTPSTHQSSATLLMFAGVVISAHLSEGQSRSPVTFLSLSLTGRRHTTQRAPPRRRRRRLVAVRSPTSGALVHRPSSKSASSTHGPSETTSVAINDLIVDHQLDLLAVVESWHDAASSPCLNAATPPGYTYVERARPRIGMHSKTNHGGTAISSDRTTPFVQ